MTRTSQRSLATAVTAAIIGVGLSGCSANRPTVAIEDDTVVVQTKDFDMTFASLDEIDAEYMIFGGGALTHDNAFIPVTIAGLDIETARQIHDDHPDFQRCSSSGATEAQSRVRQLDLIPADEATRAALVDALDRHERALRSGGDRIAVAIEGATLELESCIVREVGEEIGGQIQIGGELILVTAARLVDAADALAR